MLPHDRSNPLRYAAEKVKTLALLLVLLPASLMAQDRIVGLVEIPALHSRLNAGLPDATIGPVTLFAEPNQEAEVAIVLRNRKQLESREHGYDQISAAVYDVEGDPSGFSWYRLRYIDAEEPIFGWLNQADAGEYRDVHMLIGSGLAYLTNEWDRRIFEGPKSDAPARAFEGLEAEPDVRIIDVRSEGGERWYLLALVRGSCTGDPLEVSATGWVPAYAGTGGNTVWYRSRGC
jgi:hypothetical protein